VLRKAVKEQLRWPFISRSERIICSGRLQSGNFTLNMVNGPEGGRWFLNVACSQRWESAM
jgi:hypothetical protein